jgi:hypothetical protein
LPNPRWGETLEWTEIVRAVSDAWGKPWAELLHSRGTGARETALLLGRSRGRLSLKELDKLAADIHHNALSSAIRRFSERLTKDRGFYRKFCLIQKALNQG